MSRKPTYEELELRVKELEKEAIEHQRVDEALRESERELSIAKRILEDRLQVLLSPGKEPSDLKVTEILAFQTLKEINEAFARVFNVTMLLTDTEGNYITGPDHLTEFCRLVRGTEKGLERCKRSDEMLAKRAKDATDPVITRCSNAGLVDAVVPVRIGGRYVASWLVGQWCPPEVDEAKVRVTALEIGGDEEKLVAAYHKLKRRPIEQLEKTLELLEIFAQELSEYGMNNLKLSKAVIERKQAEEAVRISEERFRQLAENINDIFWVRDINTSEMLYLSPGFEKVFGISCEAVYENSFSFIDAVEPDDIPKIRSARRKKMKEGKETVTEYRINRPDGEMRWIRAKTSPVIDKNGVPVRSVGVASDITAHKHMEEELREKSLQAQRLADELELIIDGIPGLVFFKDTENRLVRVNKFMADAHQMTKKQLEGTSCFELYSRETAQAYFEDDLEVIQSRKPKLNIDEMWETEYGTRWLNTNKMPYLNENGEVTGVIGLSLDVTERKKAEQALRKSEEKYRNLIESLQEGIWVIDKDAKTVFVNYPMAEMLGYTEEEMVGIDLFEFMDEKAAGTAKENLERRKAGITEQHDFEFLQKDGSRVNVILVTRPITDNDGNYKGAIAGVINVTKRMQAESALRESEEKYRSLVESSDDSIYLLDRNSTYLFVNKTHLSRFGVEANEIIGRRYDDFHSKNETEEFKVRVNEVIKTGKSNRYTYKSEKVGGHYLRTLSPVKDSYGNIVAVTVVSKDITELIQAEENLRKTNERLLREQKQRKMLSKRLIDLLEKDRRQVAMELHDHIGQLLASLKMDIEMIHGKLGPEHRELGGQITAVQERTTQAIKDIKNISRGLRPGMLDALGLVPSLNGLLNEIQRQTDIEIHIFSRKVPKRFAPEKELALFRIAQEAMTNIIKYARAKKVFVNLVKKNDELSLSIEDDGIGFDQKKIMKATVRGLPFGLLIMRERAEQIDGDFTLESQPGKGTHLLVEIPI